jgi:hypothetical protein
MVIELLVAGVAIGAAAIKAFDYVKEAIAITDPPTSYRELSELERLKKKYGE